MKRDKVVRLGTTKDEDVIGADRNAVIQAIRAARTRARLTQEAAAALTHHATSTISRWETGGLPNKWDDLIEYAHAMNQQIVLEFGPSPDATKEPPPEWAGVLMARDELAAYVDQAKDEVLNAIDAGRNDLIDAIAQRVAELAAQKLDRENDEEGHDGNPDRLPGSQEPPPAPEP